MPRHQRRARWMPLRPRKPSSFQLQKRLDKGLLPVVLLQRRAEHHAAVFVEAHQVLVEGGVVGGGEQDAVAGVESVFGVVAPWRNMAGA